MLKRYLFLGGIFLLFITLFIINNNSFQNEEKEIKKEKKILYNKERFQYSTEENDDIDNVLKDEFEVIKKVKYVYEEKKEEPIYEEEIEKKNGFIEEDNNTYYYIDDIKQTGSQEIDNNIYYFDENGVMKKDVVIENCYYDEEGKLYTGFKEIDGNTFYFNKEGFMKGLNEIDSNKYYFDDEGRLLKEVFYDKYYLDENGIVVTGTKEIDGRMYVFNEDGILQNGYKVIDGKTFFLDEKMEPLKGIQLINNERCYFDFETGILIKRNIKSAIDISSWQGDIDFDKLKESNLIDGVIVRLGYGTTLNDNPVLDNKFKRNISELNRLEIPYGIYFFGYAQNEYASNLEADFVYNNLKDNNVKLSFPIFYDAELSEFNGIKYTKTMYRKVINNFVTKLNNYGYKDVGLYGNLNMLTKGSLSFSKKYPVWVAQYYTRCEYEKDYVGWQYTSDGNIPGIEGRVDLNIFY